MTYQAALEFMEGTEWRGVKPGLGRERALLKALGDPQEGRRSIHVAGTNGKGSTCAMLAAIMRAAGYKTGLYTSPHLRRINERIAVDGEDIPDADFARLAEKIKAAQESIGTICTEFELLTAMAFLWFAERGCDIAVLETGMGGRLDATNVIYCPEVAVITNIGLDHCSVLGGTVEQIAFEKAGIFKGGCAVSHPQTPSVASVLTGAAEFVGSPLVFADMSRITPISASPEGQRFLCGDEEYSLSLLGDHQLKNAATALLAVECLRNNGWDIPAGAVRRALALTDWPGRFEILMREPYFIADGGHNPQCAAATAEALLRYFPNKRRILLIGLLADKDWAAMLDILAPVADGFVAVTPSSERALPAKTLAWALGRYGKSVEARECVADGVVAAMTMAGEDGVVCSVGSLYLTGEVRECFGRR